MKKRLIFALFWADGYFCQSRNFRLQRVGDLQWLLEKYQFEKNADFVDELLLLDVSRGKPQSETFVSALSSLSKRIQLPITAGGGLRDLAQVNMLMRSGADKVVFNTLASTGSAIVEKTVRQYGLQAVTGSVDVRILNQVPIVHTRNGEIPAEPLTDYVHNYLDGKVGEILIGSIDRDGTGNGLHLNLLCELPNQIEAPIILMGGVGRPEHLVEGLIHPATSAVATGNLLNFLGGGLETARQACTQAGVNIPIRLRRNEALQMLHLSNGA